MRLGLVGQPMQVRKPMLSQSFTRMNVLSRHALLRSNFRTRIWPPKLLAVGWAGVVSSSMLFGAVHATTVLRDDSLGANPILFEPNRGQASAEFRYVARGNSYSFGITNDSVAMSLRRGSVDSKHAGRRRSRESVSVSIYLLGARKDTVEQGENAEASVSNYSIAKNPPNWITQIPNFRTVSF